MNRLQKFAFGIATSAGAGLAPFAPGTFGSIVGLGLAYASAPWPVISRLTLWIALFILGTWASKKSGEALPKQDDSRIVIDEVVGMGIAAWSTGGVRFDLLIAFVLFRFFDILKPPPIRAIDRWSKGSTPGSWMGGFGVMVDDVAAGLAALATYWLVLRGLGLK